MHLVSIEINGFKSFAKPTKLSFAPGITAVVGPNGCGKSNVVDALRWVMGEQRSSVLRGDRMESVIFNGTVTRKASGLAEVKIVLDNERGFLSTPFTEVEIARRLYRDGTSEYLLNGHECRLKDVSDLLHDSGMGPNLYTILELKMVEEILREDGEGRRAMFEEAAGVAKYKIRRRQAQAKLRQTEEDLVRLADILTEVERHVGSLKRQALRARKYHELAAELKLVEGANIYRTYRRLLADVEPLESAVKETSAVSESVRAALKMEEARLIEIRTFEIDADKNAGQIRRELGEVTQAISKFESEIAGLRAQQKAAEDARERAEREQILLDQKRELVEQRLAEHGKAHTGLAVELEQLELAAAAATERFNAAQAELERIAYAAREYQESLNALRRELVEAQRESALATATQASLAQRAELSTSDLRNLHESGVAYQTRLEQTQSAQTTAESAMRELSQLRQDMEQSCATAQNSIRDAEENVRQLSSALEATQSKIDLLQTLAERGPRSNSALKLLREQPVAGVTGLLGDVVEIDEKYRRAFQTILGPAAYYVLAASAAAALAGAQRLLAAGVGKCTFVVADAPAQPSEPLTSPPTAIGTANSLLLSHASDIRLTRLLERIVVTETWDNALALRDWAEQNQATVVALDGQWLSGAGLIHAGSSDTKEPLDIGLAHQIEELKRGAALALTALEDARAALRDRRNALATAEQELSRIQREFAAHQVTLSSIREQRSALAAVIASMSERVRQLEQQQRELGAAIEQAKAQEQRVLGAVTAAEQRLAESEAGGGDITGRLHQAQTVASQKREERHEAERRRDGARHRLELSAAESMRLRLSLDELAESAATARDTATRSTEQIDFAATRLQTIEAALLEHWRKRDQLTAAVDTASTKVEELRQRALDQEEKLRAMRTSHDSELSEERRIELEIARLRGEIDALVHNAISQHGWDLAAENFAAEHAEFANLEASADAALELREKIERLGPVNVMAVEEFEAENARLDAMLSQREDLLKAKRTIEETIARINETAQAQFLHTFEAVRAHFQRLFAEFFPAGEADLVLTGTDLLDADITLWANPSGKRLKSLSLMSGGEKTMTAIALLFALYQVKPSPFCVFDEVDAPLDDANIDRFNRVIRMHADSTQFILITHNRRTMEIADNLYGVTMEEEGISKLVSVRLLSAVA
jgi:chromosome segregation protein